MNVCTFSNSNKISKIAMPVILFLFIFSWLRKIHNFQGQNIKAKFIKHMFMHILIITLKKLLNLHISVFCIL